MTLILTLTLTSRCVIIAIVIVGINDEDEDENKDEDKEDKRDYEDTRENNDDENIYEEMIQIIEKYKSQYCKFNLKNDFQQNYKNIQKMKYIASSPIVIPYSK